MSWIPWSQIWKAAGAIIVPINESIYNATAIIDTCDVQRSEYREAMD